MVHCHRQRSAYTLVELMTVMGVIVILVALLMPAYREVRNAARTAICASNLHEIGLAAVNHKIEHRNKFPLRSSTWPSQLISYLNGEPELFICPADDTPASSGPPMAALNVYKNNGEYLQSMLFQEGPMVKRTDLDENVYQLGFEDMPGGGDMDFNDFFADVTKLSGLGYRIHARKGDAMYRFDVVNHEGDLIQSNVDQSGVTFDLTGGTSSYGMNQAIDGLPNQGHGGYSVFMLDYEKISAVVNENTAVRDDWNAWIDGAGHFEFARHHGKVNVMGLGGEVRTTGVYEIDPQYDANLERWLPGYVAP